MSNHQDRLVIKETFIARGLFLKWFLLSCIHWGIVVGGLIYLGCPEGLIWTVAVFLGIATLFLFICSIHPGPFDLLVTEEGFQVGRWPRILFKWAEVENIRLVSGGLRTTIHFDYVPGVNDALVACKRKKWGPNWCPSVGGSFDRAGEEVISILQAWKARGLRESQS